MASTSADHPPVRASRRPLPCGRREAGAVATETVVTVPLLLFLLLLIMQFALAEHAQHIAQTAAARALAATRAQGGTTAAGRATARGTLEALGHTVLQHPAVTVERGTGAVAVRISGTVEPVVPGLHLHVVGRTDGPAERWTTGAPR
jgi:Flp pilus assembly protein TadG